ncbi:MAG: hypothetical protein NUV97_01425, partial [archaeon]|nr:hypothetical protein [archaeon]
IDEACFTISLLRHILLQEKIDHKLYSTVENLKVGEKTGKSLNIFSYYNKQTIVSSFDCIKCTGIKEVYDIELEDGTIISLTGNQKVLISFMGIEIWKSVEDLTVNDEFLSL